MNPLAGQPLFGSAPVGGADNSRPTGRAEPTLPVPATLGLIAGGLVTAAGILGPQRVVGGVLKAVQLVLPAGAIDFLAFEEIERRAHFLHEFTAAIKLELFGKQPSHPKPPPSQSIPGSTITTFTSPGLGVATASGLVPIVPGLPGSGVGPHNISDGLAGAPLFPTPRYTDQVNDFLTAAQGVQAPTTNPQILAQRALYAQAQLQQQLHSAAGDALVPIPRPNPMVGFGIQAIMDYVAALQKGEGTVVFPSEKMDP